MALNARQLKAYNDLVDVFRHLPISVSGLLEVEDLEYNPTPLLTGVPCNWQSMPEDNRVLSPLGRSEADMLDTLDRFHFEAGTDLKDNDILQIKTVGHPENGAYFQVRGFGKIRVTRGNRKANYVGVFAKRVKGTPPGLT